MNFRIFANSAYIWFSRFSWNGHSKNDYFHEKNLKNISGEFVKIEEFTLVIIFFLFFIKNENLGLKWKFWNFSEFTLKICYFYPFPKDLPPGDQIGHKSGVLPGHQGRPCRVYSDSNMYHMYHCAPIWNWSEGADNRMWLIPDYFLSVSFVVQVSPDLI